MNILFVSHAANRSGAPLVLLELLRYLKRETPHQATVLSLREGPLLDDFAREAQVFSGSAALVRASKLGAAHRRLQDFEGTPLVRLDPALSALGRLNLRSARGSMRALQDRYDVVYVNSVASGDIAPALDPVLRHAPLLTHVHEMSWAIDGLLPAWKALRQRSQRFIAASEAVRTHLVDARGVGAEQVETVHEFVDFQALETPRDAARTELRARLGVGDAAFLVGGCGTMEWRKGADWWASLAAQTVGSDLHFVWLGGQANEMRRQIDFDIKRFGIEKQVHFLPATTRPAPFFAALDAFALTSREDPFPLVTIEAAAQGVPVLCFEGAGGAVELVGTDAGYCAPYGELGAMAREIKSWQRQESQRLTLGEVASRRAREMSDVQVAAPKIVACLEEMVADFRGVSA